MNRKVKGTIILTLILVLIICALLYQDNMLKNQLVTLQIENYNQQLEIKSLQEQTVNLVNENKQLSTSLNTTLKEMEVQKQNELVLEEKKQEDVIRKQKINPLVYLAPVGKFLKNVAVRFASMPNL